MCVGRRTSLQVQPEGVTGCGSADLGVGILLLGLLLLGLPLWDASWAELRPRDPVSWLEPWRLLLGHWVHHSWNHLALNALALIGWMALWRQAPVERLAQLVCISVACGAGVALISDAEFVVGLSGLLHGLFVATALMGWRRQRISGTSVVVLAVIAAKLVREAAFGPSPDLERLVGFPVATEAHLVGAAAGLTYAGARCLVDRARRRRPPS